MMPGHEWNEIGHTEGQWDNVSIWECPRCGAIDYSYIEPGPLVRWMPSILPARKLRKDHVWRDLVDDFQQRFPEGATCEEVQAWLAEKGYTCSTSSENMEMLK